MRVDPDIRATERDDRVVAEASGWGSPQDPTPRAFGRPWPLVLLVLAVFAAYAPMLRGVSTDWDDPVWLADPALGMDLGDAVTTAFTTPRGGAWYPVLRLSWWLHLAAFGADPWSMQAVHLLLFLSSIVLLFRLLGRWVSADVAIAATALWASHPSRVESVAWLTSRKDLIPLVLLLAAALLVTRPRARPRLAGLLLGLAAWTKVAVVPVAMLVSLLPWIHGRREVSSTTMRWSWPLLGAATLVGLRVFSPGADVMAPDRPGVLLLLWQIAHWVRALDPFMPRAAIVPVPDDLGWPALVGAAVVGASLVGFLRASRARSRNAALLLALCWAPLLPMLGVVDMPFLAADRHLLYPSMAIAVGLGWWALERVPRPWGRWLLAAWTVLQLLASSPRVRDWASSEALWSAEARRPGRDPRRDWKIGMQAAVSGDFGEASSRLLRAHAAFPASEALTARTALAVLANTRWDPTIASHLTRPPRSLEQWTAALDLCSTSGHEDVASVLRQHLRATDPDRPAAD